MNGVLYISERPDSVVEYEGSKTTGQLGRRVRWLAFATNLSRYAQTQESSRELVDLSRDVSRPQHLVVLPFR